jgi:Protein of unknown function (DUF3489)
LEFRIALRDEQGFTRGYTIVRQYVAAARLRAREMFVPLSHRPGHAQADFGEADGYIGGKKVRFYYFCMDLPPSDGCFVKAYPAETAEAFCDSYVAAFTFFGGVPKRERMLTLLSQPEGASIEEMMQATGWQQHSVIQNRRLQNQLNAA